MWRPIPLPYVCERVIGYSIPRGDEFWVMSYEGLHRIVLAPAVSVWTDRSHAEDYDIYDTDRGLIEYEGMQLWMLGLHGGDPVGNLPSGERLEWFEKEGLLRVTENEGRALADVGPFAVDDDWAYATFSVDGRYVVTATPDRLCVYRRDS